MPTGRKPKPPGQAVNRVPVVHPWQPAPGKGWQHGRTIPKAPDGLLPQSLKAWKLWFSSWWASYWQPEDVPTLELTVTLYDAVLRGSKRPAELTPYLDRLGITPKGRQDLRWVEKVPEPEKKPAPTTDEVAARRRAQMEARKTG